MPANDYGIDLSLHVIKVRGSRRVDAGASLDVQLKSTSRAIIDESNVRYDLEVKSYDDLRDSAVLRPRILVLYVLPGNDSLWLTQTEERTTLHGCAYWLFLKDGLRWRQSSR
jgi:hypothetical protein